MRHVAADLVDTIYAAMLGETDWQTFLDRLNTIGAESASTFFLHDPDRGIGSLALATGVSETAQSEYETYYSTLNPWMKKVAATPIGSGIVGEQIVERSIFNQSEYYNDFLNRNGYETGVGLTVFRENSSYFLLSTLSRDTDTETNLERAEVLSSIAPHLARVFRFYRENNFKAAALEVCNSIGDASGAGLIMTDQSLRILSASREAERSIAEGRVVSVTPTGRLRFGDSAMQAALQELVQPAQIRRVTATFSTYGHDVQMIRLGLGKAMEFFTGPMVAILVTRQRAAARSGTIATLAAKHRLTPAETRIFSAITEGQRVNEIATNSGIARETVRSHLKAIYAKTGVGSQVDLVRLTAGADQRDTDI